MKKQCYNHPEKEALTFCHSCGRYFCGDCLTEGIDYYYCNNEKCQKARETDLKDKRETGGQTKKRMVTRDVSCNECGFEGKIQAHDTVGVYPDEILFKVLGKDPDGYIQLECPKCQSDFRVDPFSFFGSKAIGVSKKRSRFLSVIIGLMIIISLIFTTAIGVRFISYLSRTVFQKDEIAKGPTPVERLLQSDRDELKMTKEDKTFWWTVEYPTLIQTVSMAKDRMLSTSYRTGPGGRSQVKLSLLKDPNDALVLKIKLPKEAISSIDPKTGEKIPSELGKVITIRDHNLDGMPDDFNAEPLGETLYEEEFTKDGFIKFRNSPDHQSALVMWSIGIGFSVNHFLHGVDSAVPR